MLYIANQDILYTYQQRFQSNRQRLFELDPINLLVVLSTETKKELTNKIIMMDVKKTKEKRPQETPGMCSRIISDIYLKGTQFTKSKMNITVMFIFALQQISKYTPPKKKKKTHQCNKPKGQMRNS